jgi:chemotaxis protein histidine kinase CheA
MKGTHFLLVLLTLFMCMATNFVVHAAEDEDMESVNADDIIDMDDDATVAPTTDEDEKVEEAEFFNVLDALGADLACSACELTLDTLVKKFASAESAVRSQMEEEADAKLKEEEDAKEEKVDTDEENDEEDKEEEEKEATEEDDEEDDEADEDSAKKKKKKKKDKKKKDKKKKDKKKKKSKKKSPEVKVDKKAVAQTVVELGCTPADFDGVKTIGSYPGRRYDSYGGYSSSKKKKSKKEKKDRSKLVSACNHFVVDHHDWIQQKLASPVSKEYKGMKKIKKDFCEKKHKMCKSAALGFDAESSCLMKSLRAVVGGDFDKASKLATKCPKVKAA